MAKPTTQTDGAARAAVVSAEGSDFLEPLPRLTKKVFTDLAIWMTGLGLLMGVVFPFFVMAFGVPSTYVLSAKFFSATIGAGLVVGATNHFLSRAVVGSRLRFMSSKMSRVESILRDAVLADDKEECTPENCMITVDSNDELGDAAASFNQLVEALAESQRASRVAGNFATTLASHIELTPLVDAALNVLQGAGHLSASALCVLRDGELATVSSAGIAEPDGLAQSELVQRCYRTLDMVKIELPSDIQLDGGIVKFRPRTVVAFPLHVRLVPIGVVVLASTMPIDDRHDVLIQQLLPNFAVALNNALSHERLQRVAAIDTLTGLYNRRFGLERLSQEFSRSVRSGEPLGIILFDIDHFKSVNDTYGHQVGDDVLKLIAENAKGVLREGDTLMRYGGEEFLAVLPGAGEADLRTVGERMRRIVESSVVFESTAEVRVTISLGGVSFPSADVVDLDDLIRKADAALYSAKTAGRNRLALVEA
ncbi:MAG: GGDEF domain-containing protein [Acidimicrobiia bacterium]|nr:GGDEF domain-containing protein [Acidimicrobiia bacterium]MDH5520568.1 GGDEF domain-containing protein [Acidimicrobiia bacterium]